MEVVVWAATQGLRTRRWISTLFFFQAEDGIRDHCVTGVQTCALPISTVPFTLGFAWTAAASAAQAARRPATGAASNRSPYRCGRLASDTGASTAIPSPCTSAAELAPRSTYALSTVKTGSGVPAAPRPRVRCVDFTATTPGTAPRAPNTVTR